MARPRNAASQPLDLEKAMSAIVALLADERMERRKEVKKEPRDTEIVLADAGLEAAEIYPIIGKTYDSVQKTIQRGRPTSATKKKA